MHGLEGGAVEPAADEPTDAHHISQGQEAVLGFLCNRSMKSLLAHGVAQRVPASASALLAISNLTGQSHFVALQLSLCM